MRDAVDKIYQKCGQPAYGGWTNDLGPGQPILADHVNQIRAALKAAK